MASCRRVRPPVGHALTARRAGRCIGMTDPSAEILLAAVTEAEDLIRLWEKSGHDGLVLAAFLAVQRGGAELRYITPGTNPGTLARFERVRRRVISALTVYAKIQVDGMRGGALQPERKAEICVRAMRAQYVAARLVQAAWLARPSSALPEPSVASRVRPRVAAATGASKSTVLRAWEAWLEFKPEPPLTAEASSAAERVLWRAWNADRTLIAEVESNDAEIKRRATSTAKSKPRRTGAGLPPMDFSRKHKREKK